MTEDEQKRLGKRLDFILGKRKQSLPVPDTPESRQEKQDIIEIEIQKISPNPYQPRQNFNEQELAELAESIKQSSLLQPIIVRKKNETFELITGERRLRAYKYLKQQKVPAIIRDIDDKEMLKLALIENIHRKDLNPIEKAMAFKRMTEELGITHEQVGKILGINRPTITNYIRLLELPEEIKHMVSRETLSMGHARALLGLDSSILQLELAREIISKNLSVRETEVLIKKSRDSITRKSRKPIILGVQLKFIETQLSNIFGTKVRIIPGRRKGKIVIEYYSDDDLDRIYKIALGTDKGDNA